MAPRLLHPRIILVKYAEEVPRSQKTSQYPRMSMLLRVLRKKLIRRRNSANHGVNTTSTTSLALNSRPP